MTGLPTPVVPVSWGELLDKLTILEIKRERISAPAALLNVAAEHDAVRSAAAPALATAQIGADMDELRDVNRRLWDIEDAIRAEDAAGRFGEAFVELARAVYGTNDRRAAVKRRLNQRLGSALVEEKSYHDAGAAVRQDA